jgi:hypothetical protein
MSAPTDSAAQKPRRLRLQFSLRVLLVAFTLFAIGFPIWYRWPYAEVETTYAMVGGQPDKSQPLGTFATKWQRTWGGGRVKHGPSSYEAADGSVRIVDHYANDIRSGPHRYYVNDTLAHSGQFAAGLKTGEWVHTSKFGEVRISWKEGRRHGATEERRPDHPTLALKFEDGLLTEVNGKALPAGWARAVTRIQQESPQLSRSLADDCALQMSSTPLKEALQELCDIHDIPPGIWRIDRAKLDLAGFDMNSPSRSTIGIDLLSSLAVLASLNGLACDYRYGCLWITTENDAATWTDPTGVASIQPPEGTLLENVWKEPLNINTIRGASTEQLLAEILDALAEQLAINIDLAQVEPTLDTPDGYPIACSLVKHPFHQTLGILLYETGCHCRLEGDRLVILPPENSDTPRE